MPLAMKPRLGNLIKEIRGEKTRLTILPACQLANYYLPH